MTTRTLPDGRPVPPLTADEPTMLHTWLDYHRETLALKCAGLDDAQLRLASAAPSALTLLGLVQHMAVVERKWFQGVLAGHDVPAVREDDASGGFALDPARGLAEALAEWRREIALGKELCAGRSLDDTGRFDERDAATAGGTEVSLRWILVHLIEEYARHNGHADILREAIDGVTGP